MESKIIFLLEAILDEVKSHAVYKHELWDVADIAVYLKLSKSSVQHRSITRDDFPRAVRIPTENGSGGRRWYAHEVKEWIKRNREPVR